MHDGCLSIKMGTRLMVVNSSFTFWVSVNFPLLGVLQYWKDSFGLRCKMSQAYRYAYVMTSVFCNEKLLIECGLSFSVHN